MHCTERQIAARGMLSHGVPRGRCFAQCPLGRVSVMLPSMQQLERAHHKRTVRNHARRRASLGRRRTHAQPPRAHHAAKGCARALETRWRHSTCWPVAEASRTAGRACGRRAGRRAAHRWKAAFVDTVTHSHKCSRHERTGTARGWMREAGWTAARPRAHTWPAHTPRGRVVSHTRDAKVSHTARSHGALARDCSSETARSRIRIGRRRCLDSSERVAQWPVAWGAGSRPVA